MEIPWSATLWYCQETPIPPIHGALKHVKCSSSIISNSDCWNSSCGDHSAWELLLCSNTKHPPKSQQGIFIWSKRFVLSSCALILHLKGDSICCSNASPQSSALGTAGWQWLHLKHIGHFVSPQRRLKAFPGHGCSWRSIHQELKSTNYITRDWEITFPSSYKSLPLMSHHSILSGLRWNGEEVKQVGDNNVMLPRVRLHLRKLFKQIVIHTKAVFFHFKEIICI